MTGQARRHVDRLARMMPVCTSLRGYRRSWLAPDALAAVTLLAIAVPEQLATSRLGGMPPVTGLYAFIAGSVLFALLGSNPQISVGADSTIAPLFAVGVSHLASTGSPEYINLVGIVAVVAGVLVALVGLLRLGWIAEFLSAPIISGFLAGVAVIIIVHQLPDLLGLHVAGGTTLRRLAVVATHLGHTSGRTLAIGVGAFAIVVAAARVDRRLPGALAVLIGSTLAVAIFGLRTHGVEVLGGVSHDAPRLGLRGLSWSAVQDAAPIAAVVALVIVSQSAATTRAFADQHGSEADVDRDFTGVGAGNVVAGLCGAFPVNASPPRTAAVTAAGGRSQVAGLAAAAGMVLVVLASGGLHDLPLATLAAVLIFIATRMFPMRDLAAVARFGRFEFALALVTLLTVAFVGVEQGIGVAVALAILDRTRLSARPQLHVLGRIPGTTSWAPLDSVDHPAQLPSVLVVLFATPLWYANAVHFRTELEASLTRATETPRLVVLDALGMSDIDYTGSLALHKMLDELDADHITFAIARAGSHLHKSLAHSGLLDRIGENRLFPSVDEAVTHLSSSAPPP